MRYKKHMIILLAAIFLFAMATASATDSNDTAVAVEDRQLTDEIIQASENQENTIQESNNDELNLSEDDSGKLAICNDKTLGTGTDYPFKDIQNAINGGESTIYLKPGTYTGNNPISIDQKSNIKIIGNSTILDAQGKTQIFYISQSSNITIQNIIFKNGYTGGGYGGAIEVYYSCRDCSISNCTFINNTAKMNGGAISLSTWCANGRVSNCTFINNTAKMNGGAINWLTSNDGRVNNCTFINNTAEKEGGAINWFTSNDGRVNNCTFINNTAKEDGGAISWFTSNDGRVNNCTFINNTAEVDGDAIYASACDLNADYNWFGNTADNYNDTLPINNMVKCDYRLFLKATANPDTITGKDTSNVTFKLYQYGSEVISDYDNAPFKNLDLTITATNGNAAGTAKLGEPIQFTPTRGGTASVTATVEDVRQTVEINVKGDFDLLQDLVNNESLSIINLERNYTYNEFDTITGGVRITRPITVNGNGFTIDAKGKSRIFYIEADNVVIENLTLKKGKAYGSGGAIYFSNSGTVENCNFTGNTATGDGGAVYIESTGVVRNCNFTNNSASYGGAIWFTSNGAVTNCNFTNNSAISGGAINMDSGTVSNCNFTNNKATGSNSLGGAILFASTGNVTNCNFTDNSATVNGGAVYFYQGTGSVENCNFIGNNATYNGGAVFFLDEGTVENCNFTNNKATGSNGWGGAILFVGTGNVTNCNFTGNNATTGSAIYFYSTSPTKTVSNSRFLNNRANAETLEVTKNDNNITITFTGNDNLLNAIYSNGDVTFTNVTYWSANGIANTGSSSITPSRSNKEAGQNITVSVVINGKIVLSEVYLTDENGTIVLDMDVGENYFIGVRHNTDSYYTEAEKTNSTMKFNVNVTSQTTNNKTVNITAKSNILNEVMPGKLLFILPNGTEINATYAGNGTWWAVHTFDDYSEYKINASYVGLDNVTVNNATISINKVNSTITLEDVVMNYGDSINVTVKTEGAIGITAKINDNPVSVVNNYTIPISSLNAGNYTLTVTTIPDEDHNSINKTVNLTVNKIDSVISCSDEYTLTYANHVQYISGTATGVQNIKIDGSCVWEVGFRQDGEFEIGILGDANRYNVTVTTIPDDNHNSVTKRIKVSIKPIESHIDVNDVVLNYGDSYNVSVTTEGATGVTAKIDGSDVSVLNNFTIPISGLNAGNHTLTVTTIPDKNHYSTDKKVKITVNKVNSTLTVDDVVLDYGDSVNVTVTAESATGITAKIDDNPVNVVNNYTIPISGLNAGNHTLTVTTIADINHNNVTKTAKITVNKVNSTLTVEDIEFNYNRNGSTAVSYTGATGVNASVIDQPKAVVNVDENKITVSGLDAGNYTLTVTTIADDNHNTVNKTVKVTVNPASSGLEVNGTDIFFGNDAILNYTAVNATGINMSISDWRGNALKEGVDYNITITDSQIIIRFFDDGTYTVNVTALTDDNHVPTSRNVTVHVNPICDLEVILTPMNLTANYGDTITWNATIISHGPSYPFNVNLYAYAQEGLIFKNAYSDSNYYHSSIPFTLYPNIPLYVFLKTLVNASNVNLTLNVSVRDEYFPDPNPDNNNASATVEIEYVKADLNITAPSQITVGDSASVEVALPEDATGNITVKVDGKEITTVSLINGSANVELSDLNAGNHTVEIIYSGDEKYSPANETKEITVSKQDTTAEVTIPANITVGDDANVNVKLPGDATGNVTLKLDGETVDTVPVTNGTANITIPSLTSGNHTVEIAYSGDDKYNPVSETKEVSVSKQDVTPEIAVDDANVNVKLPSDATGNVTVKVDGETVSTVPVTDGTASVKLPKLSAGNHTVEISYSGDDKYNPSTKTATVSVDMDTTILTAKNVTATYKVKKYLTITLTDSTGSPIANATVTVKLKSAKTYTTNAKGQIKVKVSSLTPKKYTAKITFKGNENYTGSNTTAKVTVKKATSKITAKGKSIKQNTQIKYTVKLTSNGKAVKNAKVYLIIGKKKYSATTGNNGKATFNIKLSKTGTYNAVIKFKENKFYKKATKKVKITVKPVWKTVYKYSSDKKTVEEIQWALKHNGYYITYNGYQLVVDGYYGDCTERSVKEFQTDKKLDATGSVDYKTAQKLEII